MEPQKTRTADVLIRIARANEIPSISAVYADWGYGPGAAPEDTDWLAEALDRLIGIVRVAPEHGALVLRGMRVAEEWRRAGIGARMLQSVGLWLEDRECYCIPYAHLTAFYGRAGFVEIAPPDAPPFLSARWAAYRQRPLDVVIMVRPA